MSISNKKIIGYKLVKGSIKKEDYKQHIDDIYNKKSNKNKAILQDNASIHKSKLVTDHCKNKKIKVINGIPYYSRFNPIEYIFSMLRKQIEDNENGTEEQIRSIIDNFIKSTNSKTLSNIFNHTFGLLN